MKQQWIDYSGFRIVRFALSSARVELLRYFEYNDGRCFFVRDTKTGETNFVGEEFLLPDGQQ